MEIRPKKVSTFNGSSGPVYALEQLPDGLFLSGGGDRLARAWHSADPDIPSHALVNAGSIIYALRYIAEKALLLIGVSGGGMHVVDMEAKKELHFLLHHRNGIYDICSDAEAATAFTAGGDGTVASWSLDDFRLIATHTLCKEKVRSLAMHPNGNTLVAACGDGSICILDKLTLQLQHRFTAHQLSANTVCFHPDGHYLLSGGRDAHLNVWDIHSYEQLRSIPAHNYAIYSISFSPNARFFATGSRDKTVKIWNAANADFLHRIDHAKHEGHLYSVNKVRWLAQGDLLLSAGDDRKIMGWKIEA